MELGGGSGSKETLSNTKPVFGLGTLESPYRPETGEWLHNSWLESAARDKRLKHDLVSGQIVFISSGTEPYTEKFGIKLIENDRGLAIEVTWVLGEIIKPIHLNTRELEKMAKETRNIQNIFSKKLLKKSWFRLL